MGLTRNPASFSALLGCEKTGPPHRAQRITEEGGAFFSCLHLSVFSVAKALRLRGAHGGHSRTLAFRDVLAISHSKRRFATVRIVSSGLAG
jgi:hypothetical protein